VSKLEILAIFASPIFICILGVIIFKVLVFFIASPDYKTLDNREYNVEKVYDFHSPQKEMAEKEQCYYEGINYRKSFN
jgi:hypothetical protein